MAARKRSVKAPQPTQELDVESLAERLAAVEARLGLAQPSKALRDERLAAVAESIYRLRQRRNSALGNALFTEPAWDMMLDLFVQETHGRRLRTKSASIASGAPPTTALRVIELLEEQGLVRRVEDPADARVKLVGLTKEGYNLVRRSLVELVARARSWR